MESFSFGRVSNISGFLLALRQDIVEAKEIKNVVIYLQSSDFQNPNYLIGSLIKYLDLPLNRFRK